MPLNEGEKRYSPVQRYPFVRNLVLSTMAALPLVACRPAVNNEANGGFGGGNGNVASEPLAQTPTSTPEPTATNTPEPTSTLKPELRFASFGVYSGKTELGGDIVFVAAPNGKITFQVKELAATCSDGSTSLGFLPPAFPYEAASFSYRRDRGSSQIIEGSLINSTTVKGLVGNEAYTIPSPSGALITCPARSVDYEASYIGDGRDTFLNDLSRILRTNALPADLVGRIDSYLR